MLVLREIFEGNRQLLGSLTSEQAKAVVEASSKLGRVWLTTIPFQPSLGLTDFEIAAALKLRTLAGNRGCTAPTAENHISSDTPRSPSE
jgi:hypothetical protein